MKKERDTYSAMIREIRQRDRELIPLNRKLSFWDSHHELIGAVCVVVTIILSCFLVFVAFTWKP